MYLPSANRWNCVISLSQENTTILFPDEKIEIDSLKIPGLVSQKLGQFYELGYLSCTYRISAIDDQHLRVAFFAGKYSVWYRLGKVMFLMKS
jgi:hypothetical protein